MDTPKIEKLNLEAEVLKTLGRKGLALIVIQSAFVFARMNNFEKTKIKNMKRPEAIIDSRAWKGKDNGQGGIYWQLEEDSDTFENIYVLAKAAMASINKMEYGQPVTDLIDAFASIPTTKGRKIRTIEKDSLKGLKL